MQGVNATQSRTRAGGLNKHAFGYVAEASRARARNGSTPVESAGLQSGDSEAKGAVAGEADAEAQGSAGSCFHLAQGEEGL